VRNPHSSSTVSKEELFNAITRSEYPAVVTAYDVESPIILHANVEHEKLTGFLLEDIIGKTPKLFQGELTIKSTISDMKRSIDNSDSWEGTVINYNKSGQPYKVFIIIFGTAVSNGERFFVAVKQLFQT